METNKYFIVKNKTKKCKIPKSKGYLYGFMVERFNLLRKAILIQIPRQIKKIKNTHKKNNSLNVISVGRGENKSKDGFNEIRKRESGASIKKIPKYKEK